MSRHALRARMLIGQSRFDMAEQELRQALLDDPNDPDSHALLAVCLCEQEKYKEATDEARVAIHRAPDEPLGHYALAQVLIARRRWPEALQSITEAIRLDPEEADFHAMKAAIHLELRDGEAALGAALEGLALEPENTQCANLRAMALVRLGRKAEAGALLDETLAKSPEDDMAHANKGWALLHQHSPKEALVHFREALRLNPLNDWARSGMIEALKARNPVYRVLLAYFLWISRLSRKAQWGVLLGLYFLPRMLRGVAKAKPELEVVIIPVVVLFGLFAIMTWIADPLFNMMLRLSRFGRHALSPLQVMASNALLVCLAGAGLAALTGYLTDWWRLYLVAIALLFMMIPVSGTFRMTAGWPRKVTIVYTSVLVLLAAFGVSFGIGPEGQAWTPLQSAGAVCLVAWLVGIFAFGWIANGLAMVTVRR